MDIRYYFKSFAELLNGLVFYTVSFQDFEIPLIVLWLLAAAIYFTFYFNFINIKGFVNAFKLVRGDYDNPDKVGHGEVSHFQALTTALSGTIGLGNIGGVAVAISLGGPGAVFWLIVAGLLGMTTKFVECTLGVKFREEHEDGSISGGPMYYLKHGFNEIGLTKAGECLSKFYAICLVVGGLGIGNLFQSNQSFHQFYNTFLTQDINIHVAGVVFGTIIAILTASVVVGGIKSIAHITEKLVPFMGLFYIAISLYIILSLYYKIPYAFYLIITEAFSPSGVTGGFVGVLVLGFRRALFSNEAGIGTSSIAHSAVRTDYPVTEGYVGLLEPFADTVVVCTITALVIILTMYDPVLGQTTSQGLSGITLTSQAFASSFAAGPYFLSFAAILFALSTLLAWEYYGVKAWTFLVGEGKKREYFYHFIFCATTIVGCVAKLNTVILISDALLFLLAIPNIIGLYLLCPLVKKELDKYKFDLLTGKITNYRKQQKGRLVQQVNDA